MLKKLVFLIMALMLLVSCKAQVKEPAVAGAFYPADKETLRLSVTDMLGNAESVSTPGRMLALISPHAGYIYSGQVAASGYKNLPEATTVVLIGPSHHASFKGASVYTEGYFKTPLGDVRVNEHLARLLIEPAEDVSFRPEAYDKEHSLEVQLPFLQVLQSGLGGNFTIVPILISQPTPAMFEHLATEIARILAADPKAIVVASTDLSHYYDYETALVKDSNMIAAIEKLSPGQCEATIRMGTGEMCGASPVMVTLEAARRMGANQAVKFRYANSGDVTGKLDNVVGYLSMGIYKTPFTEAERKELLELARSTISHRVESDEEVQYQTALPKFRADAAVFVTINRHGRLRGCIGNITPTMPLYKSIIKNSTAAAVQDWRFPPMTASEIKDMELEISILSPLIPVEDPKEIVVGRDGLYIVKGTHTGVLLPQVPVAEGWSREQFLEQVSRKAGLPPDAWKDKAELYRFEAEVIK